MRIGREAQHLEGARLPASDQGAQGVGDHAPIRRRLVDPGGERLHDQLRMGLRDVVEVVGHRPTHGLGRVVTEAVQDGQAGERVLEQTLHSGSPRESWTHACLLYTSDAADE